MPHETLNRLLEYVGLEVDNHYVPRNEFLSFRLSLSHFDWCWCQLCHQYLSSILMQPHNLISFSVRGNLVISNGDISLGDIVFSDGDLK